MNRRTNAKPSTTASRPSAGASFSRRRATRTGHRCCQEPPGKQTCITPALKEARSSSARKRGRRVGLSQILVVSQIALSLLFVLGAAFFVRTLANLHLVTIGFNQNHLLTFRLDANQAGYRGAELTAFYARMEQRFRGLPGVRAATLSDVLLVSGSNHDTRVILPGAPKQEGRGGPSTSYASVGPAFFETMQDSDFARPPNRPPGPGRRILARISYLGTPHTTAYHSAPSELTLTLTVIRR